MGLKAQTLHPDYVDWDKERIIDFDFLRILISKDPVRSKGIKMRRDYFHKGVLFAYSTYRDEKNDRGHLVRVYKKVHLLNEDDSVGLSYEFIRIEGQKNCQYEEQKRRVIALSDLKADAKELGVEHYIEILFSFFKDEIDDYEGTGSPLFKQAILNVLQTNLVNVPEENRQLIGTIQAILNTDLRGSGTTVGGALIYNMTLDEEVAS